jgi:excisionase family DNA binding protein
MNAGDVAGATLVNNGETSMTTAKISERELARRARQRALSIAEFSERYGVGRTTTYEEIKSGRLRARKIGKRTLIIVDDAEQWLRHLPLVGAA